MFFEVARAKLVARIAHAGQRDLGGTPVYGHACAVGESIAAAWDLDEDQLLQQIQFEGLTKAQTVAAAYLHDTIEDCWWVRPWVLRLLGFSKNTVEIDKRLTDTFKNAATLDERTDLYSAQIKKSAAALFIKDKDLRHNTSYERNAHLGPERLARTLGEKYPMMIRKLGLTPWEFPKELMDKIENWRAYQAELAAQENLTVKDRGRQLDAVGPTHEVGRTPSRGSELPDLPMSA